MSAAKSIPAGRLLDMEGNGYLLTQIAKLQSQRDVLLDALRKIEVQSRGYAPDCRYGIIHQYAVAGLEAGVR